MRGTLLGLLAVVAGCYRPATEQACSVTCGPGATCPAGLTCAGGVCRNGDACPVDAPLQDVAIDDPPGQFCYGTPSGLFRACFFAVPSQGMDVAGTLVINTDVDPACDIRATMTGPVCVIARSQIHVDSAASIRAYGSLPLVLISVGTFDLQGLIDVSSSIGAAQARGAGGSPTACAQPGPALLKGGGAGGSFGTVGGDGGGGNSQGFGGVHAAATPTIATVRGGCPGGAGEGTNGAVGGLGGGAVYLITTTTLVLAGGINASGGPGDGGGARAGGSGGGAGGLIGIDTPVLVGSGYLLADGGGGGCGGNDVMTGQPGMGSLHQRPPDGCTSAAVSGGDGAFSTFPAMVGAGGASLEGGGGGGGGAGIIALFPSTLTVGDRSPPGDP